MEDSRANQYAPYSTTCPLSFELEPLLRRSLTWLDAATEALTRKRKKCSHTMRSPFSLKVKKLSFGSHSRSPSANLSQSEIRHVSEQIKGEVLGQPLRLPVF
jgi:hypothetical protein